MDEKKLRQRVLEVQGKYGTPTAFIAKKLGVTREHFSRWMNDDSYIISDKMKSNIMNLDILQ